MKDVSYGNWFGGTYQNEKNFIAAFAVDPESYLKMYPEYVVPPDQKKAFFNDRKACIAGRKLVERYHWKIGDTITLKGNIFPGTGSSCSGAYIKESTRARPKTSSCSTGTT